MNGYLPPTPQVKWGSTEITELWNLTGLRNSKSGEGKKTTRNKVKAWKT
jgi:hypothetical protein